MSSGDTGSELQGPNAKLGCNLIYVKVECVSILPHTKFRKNNYREDAPNYLCICLFTRPNSQITTHLSSLKLFHRMIMNLLSKKKLLLHPEL